MWPLSLLQPAFDHLIDHGPESVANDDEIEETKPKRPDLLFDLGGWLTSPNGSILVNHYKSERTCTLHTNGPQMVVWHWTATKEGTADACAKRIMKLPKKDERAASFHAAFDRDGHVAQSVPALLGSWHAGGATAHRMRFKNNGDWDISTNLTGLSANRISYGIELVNVGEVCLINGQWRGWPFYTKNKDGTKTPAGPIISANECVEWQPTHRNAVKHYQSFSSAQLHTATAFVIAFKTRFPHLSRADMSWTHARIDPGRKTDPGPLWAEVILPKILDEAGIK